VSAIAALYRRATVSVIIVGHSMGGLVARAAHLLPNYQPHSITTIITINAPHQSHPYLPDASVSSFYSSLNHYWADASNRNNVTGSLADVLLVSIVGGHRDTLIRSDLGSMHGLVTHTLALAHLFPLFTWLRSCGHLMIR
jgi:glycosylphosphatidylinositol deacylase